MDEGARVAQLLHAAATTVGHELEPPPVSVFVDRRRRRRRARVSIAATAVTVLAVAAAVVVVNRTVRTPSAASSPATSAPSTPSVPVKDLVAGHWAALPKAPIAGRANPAYAWTGTEFLVWGGATGRDQNTPVADGADYNPTSRTWQKLPPSPLSGREYPLSVWTGRVWFVWGGYGSSYKPLADGAVFDPVARTWRRVAAHPIAAAFGAAAFAGSVGGRVLLVYLDQGSKRVSAAAYDATGDSWTALPSIPVQVLNGKSEDVAIGAVVGGPRIYLQVAVEHIKPLGGGSFTSVSDVARWAFDTVAGAWSRLPGSDQQLFSPQPLWTGDRIVMADEFSYCPVCKGPPRASVVGLLDPASGQQRIVPPGPLAMLTPSYVWAGNALLAFNTVTEENGGTPACSHEPGEAGLWDPATNAWTVLPHAPASGGVAVWTGRQLLLWGDLVFATKPGTLQHSGDFTFRTAGYSFGP